ncbi:MAG: vitamin B12-dependent ribonucleotide reductase [Bradymonadales bacterium]|nr:vitamin B12-dependent ribonucleotide reductase [Bradymonadales bacterium]
MRIQRLFTRAGQPVQEGIEFELRTSGIRNPDGSLVFEARNIAVPKTWSQVATDILAQKYFRRAGVPVATVRVEEEGVPDWMQRSIPDQERLSKIPQEERFVSETDARQVFDRLAGCWTYWGYRHGYFDTEEDARAFRDEIWVMLARQMCAPNSPQWFNTGLHWAYGISGPPQGHFYADPQTGAVRASEDAYTHPQPHACFIQGISDDLVNENGIMDLWTREARLFKYGSGTGTNFSALRGEGEPLSGGGRSSGLMSFLKIGDRAAGAIKSGGTTRRAAKMVCLDLDHPDIESFVDWKVYEEQKVAALVAGSRMMKEKLTRIYEACQVDLPDEQRLDPRHNPELKQAVGQALMAEIPPGYVFRAIQLAGQGQPAMAIKELTTSWESETYATVSGQNANNSVRIPNPFMEALDNNGDWELVRRTSRQISKRVSARQLWERIAMAAWSVADPGVQFDTTINEWHTCPADGPIRASNPCSEYMFLDDTACNLASLNLKRFLGDDGFDVQAFEHACRLWTITLEISVLMAQYPSRRIAELSYEFRTIGLGYANIGSLLMVNSIPYDSPEALAWAGGITALMSGVAYRTSAEMAAKLGPFPGFARNQDSMLKVIRNHRRAIQGTTEGDYEGLSIRPMEVDRALCPAPVYQAASRAWDLALEMGERFGFRNAQTTVIAPTGTIGLLMDCDTTGIEPDFSLVKFKKLAGGGYFKIINQSVPPALARLGYTPDQVAEIVGYCQGSGSLVSAPHINHESLKSKGFTDPVLDRLEKALASSFTIEFAFNKHVLGERFCTDTLGFDEVQMDDPRFDMLRDLGFTSEQIEQANRHACGTMTLEGAPHLELEHLAVFDCANRCGKIGRRFIDHRAHVRMLAAVQPFVSGAISKTINMPNESTVEEVKEVFRMAHQGMVKAIAIYRDGSKLSQPLQSISAADFLFSSIQPPQPEVIERPVEVVKERVVTRYLAKRRRLPNRRGGYTQKASLGNHNIYLRTGEYADGSLGEIFIDMHREGAAFRSLLNCFAIAVSLGLQFGVPLEEYVDAFVFTRFEPSGMVCGHDNIKMATSVIDYIFRELGLSYLGRTDLVQVKPEEIYAGAQTQGKPHTQEEPEEAEPAQALQRSPSEAPYAVGYHAGSNGRRPRHTPSRGFMQGREMAAEPHQEMPVLLLEPGEEQILTARAAEAGSQSQPAGGNGKKRKNGSGTLKDSAGFDGDGFTAALSLHQEGGRLVRMEVARMKGYEGDPCSECGNFTLVRNGTCLKCDTCGSTSGCS